MVQRWGFGTCAVKQPNPTRLLWRPASPLGCEGGRSARPSQKVGCRMRQARRGSGCLSFRWAGMRRFLSPQPRERLGVVVLGVASEENPYSPKTDGWLEWWLWRELMWCKWTPPSPKPAARKTLTGVLRHKIIAENRNFHFQLDYKNAFLKIIPKLCIKKTNHYWKHWVLKNIRIWENTF